jgi:hypothetical protein
MLPTTLIATDGDHITGYTFHVLVGDTAYVKHVVTAPSSRRRGVARTLMTAIAERARRAGCTTWRLNCLTDNTPALALYEGLGFTRAYEAVAAWFPWSAVEGAPPRSRIIQPEDDARVESALGILRGQLAEQRALPHRLLVMLEDATAAAVFDPRFPGASVFRVAHPDLALPLLRALKPHARPEHTRLSIKLEGAPEVAAALVARGATIRLRMFHMVGPL